MQTESKTKTFFVAYVAPALIQHPVLTLKAKMVAVCLLMHRNVKTGLCFPEEETIKLGLGLSKSTVIRALKELRSLDLVTWKSRDGTRGNTYDLTGLAALCSKKLLTAAEVAKAVEVAKAAGHRKKRKSGKAARALRALPKAA